MKEIIEEIRMHFASQTQGIRQLNTIGNEYKAYSFRQGVEYGLAIPTESEKDIYEDAAQITIKSFNNMGVRYIALSCCDEEFRNEFAKFGVFFILPGDNGETRNSILSSPLKWWNGWIGMLGNRIGGRQVYDTIAEMLALENLFKKDNSIAWTASQAGSHDIESDNASYEVKSTIKKSETTVTISSQFQLNSVKPLQLWFYRMEESVQGYSINDIKTLLITNGYDANLIEKQLEKRGFMLGSSIRDKKYVVLENRIYNIDDKFPRIVETSFKDDVFPKNIVKILYTIDLEGLEYNSLGYIRDSVGVINKNAQIEKKELSETFIPLHPEGFSYSFSGKERMPLSNVAEDDQVSLQPQNDET